MVYDGVLTYTVLNELKNIIIGARVEKIVMPTTLSIDLYLYSGQKHILKIDCNPTSTKMYLSNDKKVGPLVPPSFCMVLRKHLEGSRIISISQYMLDRIIQIDFETYSELKDKQTKSLIIELMGKHSNCTLISNTNTIVDSLKHITPNISSVRSVLPGLQYVYPITKKSFLCTSENDFLSNIDTSMTIIDYLTSTYNGFSKKFVQHIANILQLDINTYIGNLDNVSIKKIYNTLKNIFISIEKNNINVDINNDYLVFNSSNTDFSINSFLDKYYTNLSYINSLTQEKDNLSRQLNGYIKKLNKKLKVTILNLEECNKMDLYKLYGELISANLYQLKDKTNEVTLNNFYDNNNKITISLDCSITPQANAQKYFKKYSKLKVTYTYSIEQKELLENEIKYLESVLYNIDSIQQLDELIDIKKELILQNYIKDNQKNKKARQNIDSKVNLKDRIEKVIYEEYTIYIGKNNIQNEFITHKLGKTNDIWLHVQNAPGSHVVIKNVSNSNIPNDVIEYSAKLAALYSKLKNNNKVNVDYCDIKYVKKHPVNKPGLVIYTNFSTVTVVPKK